MKYTENYNLCKPENDDFYNVNQFNENADTIDTELKAHENEIETLRQEKNALSDIVYKKTVNSGVAADSDPNITKLAKVRTKHENCPTSNDIYTIITAFTDGTAEICEKFQYAINVGINYGKMYFRSKVYGLTTWSDWKEITTIDKVTAEQIGLGNVPNVTTNDQTPTYTEADTLAELVSGEKLSIAFGKIAKAISTLISHISVKATTSVFGHVKLSDSNAVTDSTGLALPATEKNASIAGTLANLIYSVNTALNVAINSLITRVTTLETISTGSVTPYANDTSVTINSYNIKRQGKIVTFEALIKFNGSGSLNNKNLLSISENIKPASAVHLLGANGTTGSTYRFIIGAGSTTLRGVSISANSTYTVGQEVCIIGSWSVE